jgi:hypothetical protein
MEQSRYTYALAGTAASYFASKICKAISNEIVISQCPSRVLIQVHLNWVITSRKGTEDFVLLQPRSVMLG